MIRSFRHKGLKELFATGASKRIDAKFQSRCITVMTVLNAARTTTDLMIPGWNTHPLKQFKPWRWSIWVSGSNRITFEFDKGDAYYVNFEQYH